MPEIELSTQMNDFQVILTALTLGFAAAISPGPLFALMISETLKYGKREGTAVALSPLFTDLPIFLLSYFVLYKKASTVSEFSEILYLFGGILLIYLGYKNITYHFHKLEHIKTKKGIMSAFLKGFMVNILNPYTYAFWFGVAVNFFSNSFLKTTFFFIAFFFSFLVTEFIIILIVNRTKRFLNEKVYMFLIRGVGLAFLFIGINLLILAVRRFF